MDEHLKDDGLYEMFVHRQSPDLLQLKIQSRHINSKEWKLWIRYIKYNDENDGKIDGWYCKCSAGARTVGCCAHVASVLWYLGYHRHLNQEEKERRCQAYGGHLTDATAEAESIETNASLDDDWVNDESDESSSESEDD